MSAVPEKRPTPAQRAVAALAAENKFEAAFEATAVVVQQREAQRQAQQGERQTNPLGDSMIYWGDRWIPRETAQREGWSFDWKANDNADARRTTFTADELWDMEFPPVSWIVPDYITPGLTLLVGAPKLGKSWLALDICNAVAQGGYTLGDRHCQQGAVLYAALEDNPRRLKNRLHKVCGRKPGKAFSIWTDMRMIDDGGLDDLRRWINDADNPRLIVIDVLNKVRSSQGKNEAPYAYDYRSVTPLKDLADEFGLAIVVIHHTRKADANDKLEKVSGTNGLTGAADTTIILDRDGEGVTLLGRGRDIEEFETALEFQKENCRWRVLGEAAEVRRSDERKLILEALEGETAPMGPGAIADVSGLPNGNVRFLLHKMAKAGEVQKVGRGKYLHPDISPPNIANIANIDGGEA